MNIINNNQSLMKKIFTILLLQFTLIMGVYPVDLIRVLSLYDLTPARMNTSHNDAFDNQVTISTNEPSESMFFYRTIDNPLSCIGETPENLPTGSKYATVVLKGEDGASASASPYILIELGSTSRIKEIRLIGRGGSSNPSGGGEILYGYSNTGTADSDFYLTMDGSNPVEGWMFFQNKDCNPYGDVMTSVQVPDEARYVKLIVTKDFLFNNASSLSTSTILYAINFYAEDSPNNIGEFITKDFELNQYGYEIKLSEAADIETYSLSGNLLLKKNNVKEVDLSAFAKGIYLFKAVSAINGQSVIKKVIVK